MNVDQIFNNSDTGHREAILYPETGGRQICCYWSSHCQFVSDKVGT